MSRSEPVEAAFRRHLLEAAQAAERWIGGGTRLALPAPRPEPGPAAGRYPDPVPVLPAADVVVIARPRPAPRPAAGARRYNPWTEEEIALLRKMWAASASTPEIEAALPGRPRQRIYTKASQLGLGRRGERIAGVRVVQAPVDDPVEEQEPAPSPAPAAAAAARLDGGDGCQWPKGDPGDEDFGFCGVARSPGRPYCPEHCRQAYARRNGPVDPAVRQRRASKGADSRLVAAMRQSEGVW